jgi:hypothetical protein
MIEQRLRDGFETLDADDQMLTDSLVMWESDVSSMLGAVRNEVPSSPNASGFLLSGSVLSRREELLFWVLILLALLVA